MIYENINHPPLKLGTDDKLYDSMSRGPEMNREMLALGSIVRSE
jgi:hypothetical protein